MKLSKCGVSVLFVMSIGVMSCRQAPLTLDQLVERNVKAVGGKAALEEVHSLRVDLHIVDPGFEVDGTYPAARPGRMRIDVSAGGRHVSTEALGEKGGWQWKGKGEPEATATATAALKHGVESPGHTFGLHELKQRGHRVELAGREKVGTINCYRLRVTFADGFSTMFYLDPESWLITRRRDVRALHPDVDPKPTTIESTMSDFRRVDGLLFPFLSKDTDLARGKTLETATVRSITLNPALDPDVFEKL